jgi:hypothetical protein
MTSQLLYLYLLTKMLIRTQDWGEHLALPKNFLFLLSHYWSTFCQVHVTDDDVRGIQTLMTGTEMVPETLIYTLLNSCMAATPRKFYSCTSFECRHIGICVHLWVCHNQNHIHLQALIFGEIPVKLDM